MPVGISLPKYLKFFVVCVVSMMFGTQGVHVIILSNLHNKK